jgi:hypothetical protein
MQDIGRKLKKELPQNWGFTLLVASHGDVEGVTLYISSIERADSLQLMREYIAAQREERNWMREMADVETPEEFEKWFQLQQERGIMKDKPLKDWCQDAFIAGRASA